MSTSISKEKLLVFDGTNKNKFPYGNIILFGIFYFIGILTSDLSILNGVPPSELLRTTILESGIRAQFALIPELTWQWQVFSYHLIHFALVHYAYIGVLMFYYVPGLERATNKRFIFVAFYLGGVLAPIINGFVLFFLLNYIPGMDNWVLSGGQQTFLGSSVGVWVMIGLSVPISYKRVLFWFGIVLLLVIEFFLKILQGSDITSNVVHVVIFLLAWSFAAKFIEFGDSGGRVGELKIGRKGDRFFIIAITIHALGLFLYFFNELNII